MLTLSTGFSTMTGSPLRRLQELATCYVKGPTPLASDEGGESGGLSVRVQLTPPL